MDRKKIEAVKRAAALGDRCFEYILGEVRPGEREDEIARRIDEFLLANGGEALSFPTICVSGHRGWLMHGEPSNKTICSGELVTLDFGAVCDGYCGDMTRTIAVGEVPDEQKKCYELVFEAKKRGIDALSPGANCRDVDAATRKPIREAGYGGNFSHGTGHGVGHEVHEEPYLNKRSDAVLKTGDIVTVEPGIYVKDVFGIRIEHLLIIDDADIIDLTRAEDKLIVL
jgi:Xaa-Pro aminopeptidase